VVAGWQPHWMFAKMKLKFLEDPKKTLGDAEQIKIFARGDFRMEQPELAQFFSKVYFDESTMADLLSQMQGSQNKTDTAKEWIKKHNDLVKGWLE